MSSQKWHWRVVSRRLILAVALGLCLMPVLWTLLAALGWQPEGRGWRGTFTLENFEGVVQFEPELGAEFVYTMVVTIFATLLTLSVAFPAAYRLARVRLRQEAVNKLMQGLLVLAMLPVISYGLPLSDLVRRVGLYGTFLGLLLTYTGAQLPLTLWILRGYLVRMPRVLEEAAYLEGASWTRILIGIVLPITAGGVTATAVLVFVLNWNLFLLPGLISEGSPHMLPVAMRDFFAFERELEWPTAAAVLLVTLAPALLLVLVAQRTLEKFALVPEDPPL